MRSILSQIGKSLYRLFLMPYLERDKYFEEIVDEAMSECERIAASIELSKVA